MNYSRMEIDELSEEIIRQFFCRYNPHPEQVDIELFVTDYLKIPLVYRHSTKKKGIYWVLHPMEKDRLK